MSNPRPCRRCGCRTTVQMDGKLFCSRCSEQIEEFYEVDEEDDRALNTTAVQLIKQSVRRNPSSYVEQDDPELTTATSQTPRQKRIAKRKTVSSITEDEELPPGYSEAINDTEGHPKDENIGNSSVRIGCLSKILWKASCMMIVELGFPEIYSVLCIFQRYLRACGVAYVENEFTEDIEQMVRKTVIQKKSKSSINESLKRLKLEKKMKGVKKLEKSRDVWDILQNTNMTENFELSSDDEDANETKYESARSDTVVRVIDTNVSRSIQETAEQCYLHFDIVVGILFVSAMVTGCLWVTISDIIRWLREDRAKVFGEMSRLNPGKLHGGWNDLEDYITSLTAPLYEFQRICFWTWQLVDIDTSSLSLGFSQLVARFLHNINLPTGFLERVLFLMDCTSPSTKLDTIYLTQQGDVGEGIARPSFPEIGDLLQCFGHAKPDKNYKGSDVFISTETKILAYILLALKLTYRLDGSREFQIKSDSFDIVEWIYQLKMRIMVWEGHAIKDVVNETKINYPLTTLTNVIDDSNGRVNNIDKFYLRQLPRIGLTSTCVPSVTPCESAFHLPNPLSADVTERSLNRNDEDRVYAPVRAQSAYVKHFLNEERTEEQSREINAAVSAQVYQILQKDYSKCKVELLEDMDTNNSEFLIKRDSLERCKNEKEKKRWLKLFPCSDTYVFSKYTRPKWAQGMIIYSKELSKYHRCLNKRITDQNRALTGKRTLFLSSRGVSDLFMTASKGFSLNFIELLELFAKAISEHIHVLYAAFTMLETQIVDRAEYRQICERMIDGSTVPLSYLMRHTYEKNKDEPEIAYGTIRVSSSEPISEPRELRWLHFGVPNDWGLGVFDDTASDDEQESSEEDVSDVDIINEANLSPNEDSSSADDSPNRRKDNKTGITNSVIHKRMYDWHTLWQLLTMRYW